jgi:hypothetical protein
MTSPADRGCARFSKRVHSPGDPSERKRDPAAFLLTLLSGTCGFGAMRVPHSCGQVGPMVEARD